MVKAKCRRCSISASIRNALVATEHHTWTRDCVAALRLRLEMGSATNTYSDVRDVDPRRRGEPNAIVTAGNPMPTISIGVKQSFLKRLARRKVLRRAVVAIVALSLATQTQSSSAQSVLDAAGLPVGTVRVDATPGHVINSFDPDSALGSSIDVLSRRDIDSVYTPHIIQESLSAGWGPITYRNNTELRMAAWHWTENGTWSDAAHRSGYFTGSTELKEPTRYILAYALPHRGFATSGDRPVPSPNASYWKSNPYLTGRFTGESDALHPQWVVVDLKAEKPVNTVRIQWASPYAATYQVEYWSGTNALDFDGGPSGVSRDFPSD